MNRPATVVLAALLVFLGRARSHAQDRPGPTLALGGDVLYEAPLAYQLRRRARDVGEANAVREVFLDLAPTLRAADLAIVNLETPVSTRYRERASMEESAVFAAPDAFLGALAEAGVDVVDLANNHAYDQGPAGLANTLRAARARRLTPVGVGPDSERAAAPVTVRAADATIALAAWTEGTNHRPPADERTHDIAFLRDDTIEPSLRAARRGGAHLVVAMFHWTQEDLVRPRAMMRDFARRAAEAGADLVVGHGPHVPGSTELIETTDGRRVHVLYSLGNLVGAMQEPGGTLDTREVGVRDAPIARVSTRWRGGRLEVQRVELLHHWISRPRGRAPWLDGGRLPVLRTMNIQAELARLRRSRCGTPCDERTGQLLRRVRLTESAMARLDEGLVSGARIASLAAFAPSAPPPPAEPAPEAASAEPASPEPVPAEPASPEPAPETPPAAAEPAEPTPASEPAPPEPTPVPEPPANLDPAARPYLVARRISADFREGAAAENRIDEQTIAELARLLREDRTLRVEVLGHATASELDRRASLARLRARRVMGLIAMRGPSRSRFEARAGQPGPPGVSVRLVPR